MILIGNNNSKTITITEDQIKSLRESMANEGGVLSYGGRPGLVNLTMDDNMDDFSNRQFDTRRVVNKNTALNGDGTLSLRNKNFKDKYLDALERKKFYESMVKMLETLPQNPKLSINQLYRNGVSNEFLRKRFFAIRKIAKMLNTSEGQMLYKDMLDKAYKNMRNAENIINGLQDRYDRLTAEDGKETAMGYYSGNVIGSDIDVKTGELTGTAIKYIALYYMDDFNFSDAMKHGGLRQTNNNIELSQQGFKINEPSYRIHLTYDDGRTPNVRDNFSLNNKDEYVPQSNPTSVAAFINKTLEYAEDVLNDVGFKPNYIVAVSSSSQYNHYFCSRLSQQLHIPYLQDFFKRNVVNVKMENGEDLRKMLSDNHLSEKEISEAVKAFLTMSWFEASFMIRKPLSDLLQKYSRILTAIPSMDRKGVLSLDDIFCMYSNYIFNYIATHMSQNDELEMYVLKQCMRCNDYKFTKDGSYMYNEIQKATANTTFIEELWQVIEEMAKLSFMYKEQLRSKNGYRLSVRSYEKFKITKIPQNARRFLQGKNVYVVADEYADENLRINKQYENGKFLIFDEDINSGATLMLSVDALRMALPATSDNQILCLCTSYSTTGN